MRCIATSAALTEELQSTLREKFTVTPSTSAFLRLFQQHAMVVDQSRQHGPFAAIPTTTRSWEPQLPPTRTSSSPGDRDLLVLKRYEGVCTITPREFLELLSSGAGTP